MNKLDATTIGVLAGGLIATTAIVVGGEGPAYHEPQPVTVHATTAPAATYIPTGIAVFDQALQAGIDYWTGRDGGTPAVVIMRDPKNHCGPTAAGCAAGYSDGTCRIWIKKSYHANRWAMTAIALHEVGHCVGKEHDDTLIMHG